MKVAKREVAILVDISEARASKSLEILMKEKSINKVEAGNDFFWTIQISG